MQDKTQANGMARSFLWPHIGVTPIPRPSIHHPPARSQADPPITPCVHKQTRHRRVTDISSINKWPRPARSISRSAAAGSGTSRNAAVRESGPLPRSPLVDGISRTVNHRPPTPVSFQPFVSRAATNLRADRAAIISGSRGSGRDESSSQTDFGRYRIAAHTAL